MDHQEAHVLMFDRDHVQSQRIKSRSHHKHQGKSNDLSELFGDTAKALHGTHEVLLTGSGKARDEFRDWCQSHDTAVAKTIVDSLASDHPTDAQVVAMARQYFKKFDQMTTDPANA
jgi:stalled ribosome rescue protein Dom34